ncbi:MAG: hypothetical protein Greene041619_249 [Candidatus Peregrinibacteria bacterium Greene0416_19]|nr:MAG: hypothetical protein Greene041619_249 [Candidatus Peregrinibacteria bacterium Greene0416_19]
MMATVRPARRIPRRFSRPIRPSTRSFVERRHARRRDVTRQWRARQVRRMHRVAGDWWAALRRWFWWVAGGCMIIVIVLLVLSPVFAVREMKIQRTDKRIDVEAVQRALMPLFRRRLPFLPAREVERLVHEAVPSAERVEVGKDYRTRTLTVRIRLRRLAWKIRIEEPTGSPTASGAAVQSAPQRQDYLTADGFHVSTSVSGDDRLLPLIRIVDWAVRPAPDTQLLPEELLRALLAAEEKLREQFGQTVRGRTVYLRAREFHIDTAQWSLWFDLKSPVEDQLERLRFFLAEVGPTGAKQYVDLRLQGRVVYR